MSHKRTQALLNRMKATLAGHRELISQAQKRLTKAPSQKAALAIRRKVDELEAQTEVLKAQHKALRRGIVPDELIGEPTK
jgi:hypothetical protein